MDYSDDADDVHEAVNRLVQHICADEADEDNTRGRLKEDIHPSSSNDNAEKKKRKEEEGEMEQHERQEDNLDDLDAVD